jgi:hypothetical protein
VALSSSIEIGKVAAQDTIGRSIFFDNFAWLYRDLACALQEKIVS